MTLSKITKECVADAIVALEQEGKSASADNIRTKLGSGNKQTILRLRNEVLADRDAAEQAAEETAQSALLARFPLPKEMAAQVEAASTLLEDLKLSFAEAQSEERAQTARSHEDSLASVRQKYEGLLADERAKLATLEAELKDRDAVIADIQAAHGDLVERLASTEQSLTEALADNARLQARLDQNEAIETRMKEFLADAQKLPPVSENVPPAAVPPALRRAAQRRSRENNGAAKPAG
ncbi:MAG: DNA-binding protein [Alphaproteobacteria bacterium]